MTALGRSFFHPVAAPVVPEALQQRHGHPRLVRIQFPRMDVEHPGPALPLALSEPAAGQPVGQLTKPAAAGGRKPEPCDDRGRHRNLQQSPGGTNQGVHVGVGAYTLVTFTPRFARRSSAGVC